MATKLARRRARWAPPWERSCNGRPCVGTGKLPLQSIAVVLCALLLSRQVHFTLATAEPPRVFDSSCSIHLFAEHPQIVTPIGATFDHKGRLLVVECHTHFPPEDYQGPKVDRIRIVEDTDGDGRADHFGTFWEGSHATMSLRRGPAPWIYVATRMKVFRIADRDDDGVAETVEELVRLDTPGNYPHNGLCGLAFDQQGHLYFGLGENLGEPYRLIGRDGRLLRGGGEGGNVYRCTWEGDRLEQVATGFWNPFGIHVDLQGRVWAVENDPDASPPCRLLHIVPGGDYGYQFRYGRTGRHPLQAWNGELPGTLPMTAGTGEAPCAVLPIKGKLWVTSWGDNRIERFTLLPRGASFSASVEVVVQGDHEFRPVDFALSPSGELFVTDWVDKSYPVHGRGRIWRITFRQAVDRRNDGMPPLTSEEQLAHSLMHPAGTGTNQGIEQRRAFLDHPDPFLRQAAVWAEIQQPVTTAAPWDASATIGVKVAQLQRARWLAAHGQALSEELLQKALTDESLEVRLYAVRMVADFRVVGLRRLLEQQLTDIRNSPRLFQAILAAWEWLDSGRVSLSKEPAYDEYLLRVLQSADTPPLLRATALRLIDPDHRQLHLGRLERWTADEADVLRREAIRTAALRTSDDVVPLLARVAMDEGRGEPERADALTGLAGRGKEYLSWLLDVAARPGESSLAQAARLALRPPRNWGLTGQPPSEAELDALLRQLDRPGDPEQGWRLFFSPHGGRCAACHRWSGRGNWVGPDLTGIGRRIPRRRLLQSIVDPSREIAPQYVPWIVELADGRIVVGLSVGVDSQSQRERFVLQDGSIQEVPRQEIISRRASPTSIMPAGLHQVLTVQELRDLIALLESD